MAGSKSAFLEATLLDFVLGNTSYTPPATVYVALSTSPFSPAATGSAMDEVTGGAYARQALTNNDTSFPDATGSAPAAKSNGVTVTFPTATASWGTVQSAYLVDAGSAGHVLWGADLAASVTVDSGSGFSIPAGQFVISET